MDISTMKWELTEAYWKRDGIAVIPLNSAITVRVYFRADGIDDQTEFCIMSCDRSELYELFCAFCIENQFSSVEVKSVHIVRIAESMDRLVEIEELESCRSTKTFVEMVYTDGTQQDSIPCDSVEDAWEVARTAAMREAEKNSALHLVEVGLYFNRRNLEIRLRYHDNSYCTYRIVRRKN